MTSFDTHQAQSVLDRVCFLSKLSLDKGALPLIVTVTESSVLTKRMKMANTSGSTLAHVPHLPFILELAVEEIWREIEVVLKWAEGKLRPRC